MLDKSISAKGTIFSNYSKSSVNSFFSIYNISLVVSFIAPILLLVYAFLFIPIFIEHSEISNLAEWHRFSDFYLPQSSLLISLLIGISVFSFVSLMLGYFHKIFSLTIINFVSFLFSMALFIVTIIVLMPD